ncbi:D-glycerate dehydrogenase [Paraburkholderia nemoris]|uniref:2-hydroxyacid dehydrogenase n=1 Tax=Paraburkholderia nemoris TaxID=2793076 RepID=UPI0038BE1B6F
MKEKILITRKVFPSIVGRLQEYFDVESNDADYIYAPDELRTRLQGKVGALVSATEIINAPLVQACPSLRAVANIAVGYNNLDLAALSAAGVVATNTPDVLTETTADFGWALLMATARRTGEAERWLRLGLWDKWALDMFLGVDIHGTSLGILGMGRIGRAVAQRAHGFGMTVRYHDRAPVALADEKGAQFCSKEALLSLSDHLVITMPYDAASHHTIGRRELALMKQTATLINISRGGLVDEDALADALADNRLAGAGLDVFEREPFVCPRLLANARVVATPHIASASLKTRLAMTDLAADNLIAALGYGACAGQPPSPLNPAVLRA